MTMSFIIEALNSVDTTQFTRGEAHYQHGNHPVPRVTEILSKMIHRDSLMYWANSLGFKGLRYKDVLNNAANIGTMAHSAIEKYLKEKLESPTNIPFLGFLSWYNIVTQDIGLQIEPILIEKKLTCPWFGGTLDALMRIGNKVYLVDFKTSNHVTFTYFLQLAAYRFMLAKEGINIDGVIVLQLDKDTPGFNEYLLDFTSAEHEEFMLHCEETFLSLVLAFYNVELAEKMYKNIF